MNATMVLPMILCQMSCYLNTFQCSRSEFLNFIFYLDFPGSSYPESVGFMAPTALRRNSLHQVPGEPSRHDAGRFSRADTWTTGI